MDKIHTSNKSSSRRLKVSLSILALAAIFSGIFVYLRSQPKQASTDTEIVVVLPLSGKGASHGEYVKEGIQMYAKDHPNSHLHVTLVDSESDPKKALSGFQQRLLIRKPAAVISVLSGVSDTLAPAAQENGILLIGVNTAPESFVKDYTCTQRINDRPSDHTAPLAKMAAQKFNAVGMMYSNDAFGQFCRTTFETAYRQSNQSNINFEPFNPSESDQSLIVQRLLSKKPDAIFVAGYGQGYITIFQTLRTFKYTGPIFADIDLSNPTVLAALGDAADGIVFAAMGFNVTPPSTQEAAAFLTKYKDEFKREPWLGSAFAYDSLSILDHLIDTKQPLGRKSIFSLKTFPGIAAPLSFPTPGECQYVFQFVRREGGKNLPVKLEKLTQ